MHDPLIQDTGRIERQYRGIAQRLVILGVFFIGVHWVSPTMPVLSAEGSRAAPSFLKLSLDDALALFLKQNLELLIVKYGIDSAKGRAMTAGLFPNPTLSINTLSAYTQKCNLGRCGAIMAVLSQLFEVAGKRGFRVESAGFGTRSAEARFEDSVRKLRFAVKDAYYRVQVGRQHLAVDRKTRDRFTNILAGKTILPSQTMNKRDLIRLRILSVEAQSPGHS